MSWYMRHKCCSEYSERKCAIRCAAKEAGEVGGKRKRQLHEGLYGSRCANEAGAEC